ncbi:MAG: anhydro-N-acetylmuramic acid kinase [Xenococcaceae cyanobacterium]
MYCIGLMSGTSVDGIDAALVEITGTDVDLQAKLLAGETFPYPAKLREKILAVCEGASLSMAGLAALDDAIACQFALAAQKIQARNIPAQLIGSHGQTVYHRPPLGEDKGTKAQGRQEENGSIPNFQFPIGYSLQLGRGEVIANLTGIPTVSDFRGADIASGGQGAPIVPKVDAYLLSHPTKYRCIQNLGGIGNVTYLPARQELNWEQGVCGWDTGPGNALLDLAVQQLTEGSQTFDDHGNWAARGTPCQTLVNQWLRQDFFQQPPPKSTGRELFGEAYLAQCWEDAQAEQLSAADWLATLTELTVASIVHSYRTFLSRMPDELLLCGGGSRNLYLKQRLQAKLALYLEVLTTDEAGVSGDFKEAIAFAVLAYWRFSCSLPGNLPQVTGARQPMLLGEIHLPVA